MLPDGYGERPDPRHPQIPSDVAESTKTTIYPVFANEGDIIDLTQFAPDAERIVFDVGYDKQPQLSINASNKLVVGSGAQTCLVKLKAINRIDATETDSFQFYLIVRRAEASVWRKVSTLAMRAGSSYDLFQLVPDADAISFRSGRTRLAGSSLSNGMFTIGTTGGVAEFTAQKGSLSSHIAITIDVVQKLDADVYSDISGYRVEIAGIDVTSDVQEFPVISKTLDVITLNQYRVNDAVLTLRDNRGKYNPKISESFWKANGLNTGGFNEPVKIFTEHSDSIGNKVENLLFSGFLIQQAESISDVEVKLTCVDIANRLHKQIVSDFGILEKWDALRKQSDESSYEGNYVPERSLVPMQEDTGEAWHDRKKLKMSGLQLRSEGPPQRNKAYMTANDFRTAGGFLPENPLLRFKAEHRSEDARFLINQLAINQEVYNTHIELPEVELDDPFILNRGSASFSVEKTRVTRLPVDWVHDSTNDRILVLLSNPEGHISDLLVQYNLSGDSYRVLHTFDNDIAVHRIERRNATNYYILTSAKIAQDRSARQLPRTNDATGYVYDSVAEGSEIKIYHYSTSTGTLTEHVAEDDSFPPQLGIHYYVGFENLLYIDEFEGIRPDYRGPFKWHDNNLYYRYAKDSEFGVARVDASGTTERLVHETKLATWNHLNAAFDVTSTGTVYMVHCWKLTEAFTIVEQGLPNGASRPLTISNDLSGVGPVIQLLIDVTVSRRDLRGDTRGTITGIDENGNTVSENYGNSGGSNGAYRGVSEHTYQRITSVTGGGSHAGANVKITSILGDITTLEIRKRTAAGVETTLFSKAQLLEDTTKVPPVESTVIGVHEAIFHNNFLYFLAIVATLKNNNGTLYIDRTKSARMILYRCNVSATNPTLTLIESYDFVKLGACNLTIHDNAVHFMEHPIASGVYRPINPDLDGYWTDKEQTQTMGYNVVEESLGALKKISSSGEVEDLGNLWFEERPYNVAVTRCLSFDDELHLIMGYGNLGEVLRYNSLASAAENVQHLVLGRTLRYVLPTFSPNGSMYDALAEIARNVNATLVFDNNLISIQEREAYRAETNGATGTGTGSLAFHNANKVFPSSGYLLIEEEILRYADISGGAFTGITRGVLGSAIMNHSSDSEIVYLDTVFGKSRMLKNFNILEDTARIHNVIRSSDNRFEVKDKDSIAMFGEVAVYLEFRFNTTRGSMAGIYL